MKQLIARARTWIAARRDARAYAEVKEIVDTDEWLVAMAGGHSLRPHGDSTPTSQGGF